MWEQEALTKLRKGYRIWPQTCLFALQARPYHVVDHPIFGNGVKENGHKCKLSAAPTPVADKGVHHCTAEHVVVTGSRRAIQHSQDLRWAVYFPSRRILAFFTRQTTVFPTMTILLQLPRPSDFPFLTAVAGDASKPASD